MVEFIESDEQSILTASNQTRLRDIIYIWLTAVVSIDLNVVVVVVVVVY